MTSSATERVCVECRQRVPFGRKRYCSPRCSKRAANRRQVAAEERFELRRFCPDCNTFGIRERERRCECGAPLHRGYELVEVPV